MWDRVLQFLAVTCSHRHISQPFSAASPARHDSHSEWENVSQTRSGHYVVCLDCGKHFDYDWARMQVVR